jgi:F0F1-type ATP synthase assembly protein I
LICVAPFGACSGNQSNGACEKFHKLLHFARSMARQTSTRQASTTPPASELMGLGMQFVVAILLFLFVGKWLDAKLGTSPWLLILGVFVGAGAGFYAMYRKVFGSAPKPPRDGSPGP